MNRTERSAGMIVFRLDGDRGEHSFLLLDYGRHWDFPKGHVDAGESDLAAAVRELREETGIDHAEIIDGFSHEITYFFRGRGKQLVRKTVIFFLAHTQAREVRLSHEHVAYACEPYERAIERVTYKSSREVLQKAQEFLDRVQKFPI